MAEYEPSAEELFGEVLDLGTAERSAYLRKVAPHQPQLRAEVEALLADYAQMGSFGEPPMPAPEEPRYEQDRPGTVSQLGRYVIEKAIGAGGMGEVFRAHDTKLNRTVAIKVLPPGQTTDGPAALRFLNEARLASSLNHPNIVALYDIAKHDEIDFLVMEYVEGQTLWDLIPEEGMKFEELVSVGSQVALALGAAHAAGIVHRDIKPANIMITREQQAKVLDFGVAKGKERSDDPHLTGAGNIIGTVAYMSPEQTRGEVLDFRSDIFSFGCVMYEAAAGRGPFLQQSDYALIHEINTAEPELLGVLRPDLPSEMVRLVMHCLAKNRNDRPDSAMELATALKSLEYSREPAPSVTIRARRPSLAVLPFKIRGAASDQFLSISLAESLIHRLSATGEMVVRPIVAVLKYAEAEADWTKQARELNVDLVVEGTIQIAGGRIRVMVCAHRMSDMHTLASIKQDGDSSDLFALQDRLSDAVSEVFAPQGEKPEARIPPTRNSAAYEFYLRAVDRQVHVEKFDMASAIEMLTRATELDPGFADAWGLLAQACTQMGSHLDTDPKWFEMAERAIARTLELDPVQCTALCARSIILWSPSRGFQNRAALRALNAALRIDPTRATARHQRAAILWHLGFTAASEKDALQLKVTSPALSAMHLAAIALQSGHSERSVELYERALEIDPNGVLNHLMSPVAVLYSGRIDAARVSVRNARQMFPLESFGVAMEAILAGIDGEARRAEALADEAAQSTRSMTHTHHTWHSCAAAYALANKPEKAMFELERCAAMGLPNHRYFQFDPYLKLLHGRADFKALMSNIRREQDSIREEFAIVE